MAVQERQTGVFGVVKNEQSPEQEQHYLRETSEDDPRTIYNVFFREYDEERQS